MPSLLQRAHTEMTKDIGLMNALERYALKCEADAAKARAAVAALEVRMEEQ
jgi:hypothetical protein